MYGELDVEQNLTPKQFLAHVDVRSKYDCWLWKGLIYKGYGMLRVFVPGVLGDGLMQGIYAHRLSYQLFVGFVPLDLYVCHACDVPGCVNPTHLFLGTAQDNATDRRIKGRNNRNATPEAFADTQERIQRAVAISLYNTFHDLLVDVT